MKIRPAVVAAAVALLLGGCVAPSVDSDSGVEESAPAAEAPAPDSPIPSSAPSGCALVTPDMVIANLGIDPGACEPVDGWADGEAGSYPAITMTIDTTASAPMYMPVEVCGGTGIENALPVPGADHGYAVEGDLCVVSGGAGVKVSALLDAGTTSAADWQRLALAILALL